MIEKNKQQTAETLNLTSIYDHRFGTTSDQKRYQLWRILCDAWIQPYVSETDIVLDLAAGRCEFINQIHCGKKIAVDLNTAIFSYASPDVRVIIAPSDAMKEVDSESVDVVFVSNFFEHLPTKQAFLDTLREIHRVLRSDGTLLVLQPNIRLLNGAYWDFVDHYLPLTDKTLVEAFELVGFRIQLIQPRFLPYTTKSRLPQSPWLVRLYLRLPIAQWLFGKQTWVVARR